MKKAYEKPELTVTSIEVTSVITLSGTDSTLTEFSSNAYSTIFNSDK
ncbi:MAG: hypothetical protein LIO87_10970 [Eubacterium sp.]|nr:hypothetical protein [Eubacterium sp.]